MSFLIYDLSLLILFASFVSYFLYKDRKNVKKEGLLLLYKTSWGIKIIKKVGEKYKKTLNVLSFVSIGLGYILMVGAVYLFGKILFIYINNREVVRAVKIPPIMPLIPYLPRLFKLDFLPPFYFIYWIIILAIIAIPHEFFHGIFAAHNKIKIKKTGFGFFPNFFPVFLAAFVEPDDKQMKKKSIFAQLSVLSAGTFANIITGIIAFVALFLFFQAAYSPVGMVFSSYPSAFVNINAISSINKISIQNHSYENILKFTKKNGLNVFEVKGTKFIGTENLLKLQNKSLGGLTLFYDAPAIRNNLSGAITKINGRKTIDEETLREELDKYHPGEKINISLKGKNGIYTKEIILGKNPRNKSEAFLGVGFLEPSTNKATKKIISLLSFKKPYVLYEANTLPGLTKFFYNFLWWLVLIAFSVGIINMVPMGIFDGGRFFYLTIFAITKSEKIAEKSFKFLTFIFLGIIALLLLFWGLAIF